MITRRQRLRLVREMSVEKPTLWIGKNGVTQEVVGEVNKQLKRGEVAKVRVLKNALEETTMEALAKDLIHKTGAELIGARGHTLTLYKPKSEKKDQDL